MSTAVDSSLSSELLDYAKALHTDEQKGDHGLHLFHHSSPSKSAPKESFYDFLTRINAGVILPEKLDTSHPLSHYYVSSSHNTYLWGNQLYGHASTTPYTHVLEHGCRCVEIDVWNGEEPSDSAEDSGEGGHLKGLRERLDKKLHLLSSHDEPAAQQSATTRTAVVEPRVLHGHTATKEVPFRKVCEVIRDHAFTKSDMPLIVSLEIHTNPQQQQMMVSIMRETWGTHLIDPSTMADDDTPLPTLESMRNKILIKVKYSKPEKAAKAAKPETAGEVDSSGDESAEQVKKGKIIEALGSMGIYTRSCHFKSFAQPEAKLPTHVFALSESKLIDVYERDPSGLFQHNKSFLMRAYPKGLRISSSNLDPAPFWRRGVQMVALNWQNPNAAMMLNHAMFADTPGWVLKPPGFLPGPNPVPIQRGTLNLTIQVFAGQNIGPVGKKPHPYIRCELHVEERQERLTGSIPEGGQTKDGEFKAHTSVASGGRDPDFEGQALNFRDIKGVTQELAFVRFKVMDDDALRRDVCIAWACFRLSRLRKGVGLVRLCDEEGDPTNGALLVRVWKDFVVDSSAAPVSASTPAPGVPQAS